MATRSQAFMADAERLLKESVCGRPNAAVWRGDYPRRIGDREYLYNTIVVGLADTPSSETPPPIVFLRVWMEDERGVYLDFNDNDRGANNRSSRTPLGGDWNPMEKLRELIPDLQALL
jgi:hypothetical protein